MARSTDLVEEKSPFLKYTSCFSQGKIKFLQLVQDTIRQTCCQKLKKRFCKNERTHEVSRTTSLFSQLYVFWITPYLHPVEYVLNGWPPVKSYSNTLKIKLKNKQ